MRNNIIRKYNEEIEGLMVEITYDYDDGCEGDDWAPPTYPEVSIRSWRLIDGEKAIRNKYPDITDSEWEEWMDDIERYVHDDAKWDIVEFEESLKWG